MALQEAASTSLNVDQLPEKTTLERLTMTISTPVASESEATDILRSLAETDSAAEVDELTESYNDGAPTLGFYMPASDNFMDTITVRYAEASLFFETSMSKHSFDLLERVLADFLDEIVHTTKSPSHIIQQSTHFSHDGNYENVRSEIDTPYDMNSFTMMVPVNDGDNSLQFVAEESDTGVAMRTVRTDVGILSVSDVSISTLVGVECDIVSEIVDTFSL